jgi:hypothetical protein
MGPCPCCPWAHAPRCHCPSLLPPVVPCSCCGPPTVQLCAAQLPIQAPMASGGFSGWKQRPQCAKKGHTGAVSNFTDSNADATLLRGVAGIRCRKLRVRASFKAVSRPWIQAALDPALVKEQLPRPKLRAPSCPCTESTRGDVSEDGFRTRMPDVLSKSNSAQGHRLRSRERETTRRKLSIDRVAKRNSRHFGGATRKHTLNSIDTHTCAHHVEPSAARPWLAHRSMR